MSDALTERLQRELLERSFPRLQMLLLVTFAGLGAFLVSAACLHWGLVSMSIRYFVAALSGYSFFLVLVRLWLAYQRRQLRPDVDLPVDLPGVSGHVSPSEFVAGGGEFGGAGASGSFGGPASEPPSSSGGIGVDVDDAALVVLAVASLAVGVVAIGFVVHGSPVLFAEVLLDAAAVSAVYRRARGRARGHWLHGVMRRTWRPALALCCSAAIVGFAVQYVRPDANSIGNVFGSRP